jgi:uncharacterized protein YeaO (DUF488 family)
MSISVLRLGSPRPRRRELRIGTVRRPPRGVPRARLASDDWYDTWLPALSPSAALVKRAQAARTEGDWNAFRRAYREEMSAPDARHLLALLAALSRTTDLAVGCYCPDERRCHRSVLGELLAEAGAEMRTPGRRAPARNRRA